MIKSIAIYPVFGKPLVVYIGIITLLSFLITATIAILNNKDNSRIPFKWHPRMAKISFTVAFFHAILALSLFL